MDVKQEYTFGNVQDYEHLINQMNQYGFSITSRTMCDLKRLVRMRGFNLVRALDTMKHCNNAYDFTVQATAEVYMWQNQNNAIV